MSTTGNKNLNDGFLDVLLALKDNCMRNINVAEVCIVESVDSEIRCSLLNNKKTIIHCAKLENLEVSKGDCVLVIFTNTDFRNNLKRLSNNQTLLEVTEVTHKINCGIIIGIIKENIENASE